MKGTAEPRSAGSQFPASSEDEDMTYGQARLIRRFRKGRRPDTASGTPPKPAGDVSKVWHAVPT
jgi:hypothetical protein